MNIVYINLKRFPLFPDTVLTSIPSCIAHSIVCFELATTIRSTERALKDATRDADWKSNIIVRIPPIELL